MSADSAMEFNMPGTKVVYVGVDTEVVFVVSGTEIVFVGVDAEVPEFKVVHISIILLLHI